MKIFFPALISAFFLLSFSAHAQKKAQARVPDVGTPTQPSNGSLFEGDWEWSSGGDVFLISLTRNSAFSAPDGTTHSVIVGKHRYTKNGAVIEQSFTGTTEPYTLFGKPTSSYVFTMSFHDLSRDKWVQVVLTTSSSTPDQITWELKEKMNGVTVNHPVSNGFTVPTSLTLIRK